MKGEKNCAVVMLDVEIKYRIARMYVRVCVRAAMGLCRQFS